MRILIALVTLLLAASVGTPQSLVAGRASQPPLIDAVPDDPCWAEAMIATDFSVLASGGEERAFYQTTARAAWDDRALYLHIICLEPEPDAITAEVTQRDGPVWLEDALEIFLQPDPAQDDHFQFVVNALGTVYDARNDDGSFNARVRAAAQVGEQAWQVELAIPWADLGVPAPQAGQEWGFNVGRERRPNEPTEWSTWAPLEKDLKKFAVPEAFGRLRFTEVPEPGRASGHVPTEGLVDNPDFSRVADGRPEGWRLSAHSTLAEIAPMSGHFAVRNDGDYGVVSQSLNLPAEEGQVFTVYVVARASEDATIGAAVVQDMEEGSYHIPTRDMYPFWNIGATGNFMLYTGRIVTNKGVKQLRSVNLYRSNRAGWVEYAYIQVLPGLHGLTGIAEAERCTRPDERGLGEPWPTPAVPALKPLPGGPLNALIFIGEFQRDAVELAQRLDLDYDLVYCPTYRGSGKVDAVVAFGADRIMRRLAGGHYDLIILAGRPSEETVIRDILRSVEEGTGLVAIEPVAGGAAAKPEVLARLLDRLPTEALPPERLPEVLGALDPDVITQTSGGRQVLQSLAVADEGEGRMARLTWSDSVPGLIPFHAGSNEWWEYRWAALARTALWAARRAPASRIAGLACEEDLTIEVRAPQAEPLDVTVQWDGRFQRLGSAQFTTGPLADGAATLRVPIPPEVRLTRAPAVARVLLSDRDDHALDAAACLIPGTSPRVRIDTVEAPDEAAPGETVTARVRCTAEAGGQVVQAELWDAFGRVVARARADLPGLGEHVADLAIDVRSPLSVYHRIVVSAPIDAAGEVVADRLERDLLVPAASADHLEDFRLAVGYAVMQVRCPAYLQDHLVAFLRSLGVEACTVNEYMIRRGMPAWGGTTGGGMSYSDSAHIRPRCFSDPEMVATLARETVERVGGKRRWGFVGYNMNDEVHLHQAATVEVCACDHCARGFKRFSQETYGIIAAVNAQWGTDYASFDDITIPLLANMRGAENPARWVDFRLLMERVWAGAYAAAHAAVREAHPDVNMSFTNPYKYNSLSGTDFSLWVPHEEVLLRYFHRHVVDRNKSWSSAPMLAWFGYRSNAPQVGHFMWWFALNGGVMPIWWDPVEPWAYSGKEGFTPWYMAGPLWRPTGRSEAVTAAAGELQGGLARLLRAAEPAPAEAAILHSQPSMHVLYADAALPPGRTTDEGYNRYRASDDALAAALKRHAFPYRYLLPEQLDEQHLAGVRLIALPSCVALSDGAVAALRAFVAGGGKLLADVLPATHDGHGKPRKASPLEDLFAGDDAEHLGAYADAEAGPALDEALAALGVAPAITWQTEDGALPARTELYAFRLGEAQVLGIVRAPGEEAAQEGPLDIRLPDTRHVYDCRAGEALGRRDRLTVDLAPGDARILALLPYAPTGLAATARAGEGVITISAQLEGVAAPDDHVFRVEVTPPGAEGPAAWYSHNVVAQGGRLELGIPLALNDPPGTWRVAVRDVATGMRGVATVTVGSQTDG